MMNDPYTTTYLAKIRVQEMQEQARQAHLANRYAAPDRTVARYIVTRLSGWLQRARPTASVRYTEPKRATAEIPGL